MKLLIAVCFYLIAIITKCSADDRKKEWWEHATVYQIYPRSFADSNGDGIGDLPGITSKLNHLNEIGVDTIWLSPIFQSPQKDFGYDVSDFYAIHHEYGSMEDFEEFVNEARKRNINVLLDFVPNHSSDQCAWFQRSVSTETDFMDYYVWKNGEIHENGTRLPPNNWVKSIRSPFSGGKSLTSLFHLALCLRWFCLDVERGAPTILSSSIPPPTTGLELSQSAGCQRNGKGTFVLVAKRCGWFPYRRCQPHVRRCEIS